MQINRRQFLIGSAGLGVGLLNLPQLAWGAPDTSSTSDSCVVVVFLRGGMDGLHLVGPSDDADYIAARPPQLRVTTDGETPGIPLPNGPSANDFRMHPAAAPLAELYAERSLAVIHATGLINGSRSHFEAQDMMEHGIGDGADRSAHDGWLARYVTAINPGGMLPVVALGASVPKSLMGSTNAVAMQDLDSFNLLSNMAPNGGGARIEEALRVLYGGGDAIASAGAQTLATLDEVRERRGPQEAGPQGRQGRRRQGGQQGNAGALNAQFQSITELLKLGFGVRVATVDYGGWDTHQNQPGRFQIQMAGLSEALHGFWDGLGDMQSRVTVVVLSEFGRRVQANQSAGTDHGHGNLMLALGAGVKGGRIHGTWPGLDIEQLDNRVDLAITTDYRSVLAEVLTKRGGLTDVGRVFPGLESAGIGVV